MSDLKISKDKIWLEDGNGNTIAFVEFPEFERGKVEVTHTVVDPSLQGKGIAGMLMKAMAEKLVEEGRVAELTCSYAIRWFDKNRDYSDALIDPEIEYKKADNMTHNACGIPKHKK
ncbi:MAG: N-acetyltransferase [Lachnospiraceae bacterium]|nr:N-acetyltransferase [Lachnospiraceae bacterium]